MYDIDTLHRDIILKDNFEKRTQVKLTLDSFHDLTIITHRVNTPNFEIVWSLKSEGIRGLRYLTKYPLSEYKRLAREIKIKEVLK